MFNLMSKVSSVAMKGVKKIKGQAGFWEYVAGVAVVLVIIAFIAVPTLRNFVTNVFTAMSAWWNSIKNSVFQTT